MLSRTNVNFLIAGIILVGVLMATAVFGQSSTCSPGRTIQFVKVEMDRLHPGIEVEELDAVDRPAFVSFYNATPPVSDTPFNRVFIFHRPAASTSLVFLGINNCLTDYIELSLQIIRQLRDSVRI